ncbi:hypothetical protein [Streptomyces rugosispiralis]|uniref:Cupin domain-containing protein n=1 Tax=Streptomyces rugosispiralis TaxID=2967341 RepID=A0ABT1V963_9ACTN|nr:hypothetical protein [Streptomyces rugosispiralis]MCQ8193807.1 hypothetical protein [Streptomyces rugosispiralis]
MTDLEVGQATWVPAGIPHRCSALAHQDLFVDAGFPEHLVTTQLVADIERR